MRQWRVGSFSMGLALILFGVLIMVGQVRGWGTSLEIAVRWWPVVLILVGVEVLLANALSGQDKPFIRYDWFGVLVTLCVVLCTAGVYTLTAVGVLPAIQSALTSTVYSVELPETSVSIDRDVSKVVVTAEDAEVEIRAAVPEKPGQMVIFGDGRVSASSEEDAINWAKGARVVSRKHGTTLYLSLKPPARRDGLGHVTSQHRWIILAPADRPIEFSELGTARVVARGLSVGWSVQASGPVAVELSPSDDVRLLASSVSPEMISGNVAWSTVEGYQERTDSAHGWSGKVAKTAAVGSGRHVLRIDTSGEIRVTVGD
ncbi:MAG: hypothetical protein IMW97_01385 [Firmicutes bacterium]|nr:hypothetical protein [Candidatus Fermentithermobacillaceae bacterium]